MKISSLLRHHLLRKSSTRWLLVLDVVAWVVLTAYMIGNIRPRDSAVALRFSSLNEFVALGKWYWHFLPALFLLTTGVLNTWIAATLLRSPQSPELTRLATKVMLFQLFLSALTITVSYHLITAAKF